MRYFQKPILIVCFLVPVLVPNVLVCILPKAEFETKIECRLFTCEVIPGKSSEGAGKVNQGRKTRQCNCVLLRSPISWFLRYLPKGRIVQLKAGRLGYSFPSPPLPYIGGGLPLGLMATLSVGYVDHFKAPFQFLSWTGKISSRNFQWIFSKIKYRHQFN